MKTIIAIIVAAAFLFAILTSGYNEDKTPGL